MARTPFMWLSLTAAALLCSVFDVEAQPVSKPGVRFPLTQNSNYKRNATAAVLRTINKYSRYSVSTFSEQGVVPMTDYEYDVEYYGVVGVGTPAQALKLDFDTGSSDLWFAAAGCTNCGSSQTLFQPSKSSTFRQPSPKTPWQISYGDGSTASGYIAYDTVNLGGYAIKNQAIDLAAKESSSFQDGPIDGLLGLGFDSLTTVRGIKTPMTNLVSQGLISEPIFGVWLGKQSEGGGGEYYFGGYNPDHIDGTLKTVPIDNSDGWWGVTVDSFKKGTTTLGTNAYAILDTGTSLIILADSIASTVAKAYGATANSDGTYTISCDTSSYPPLQVVLNGVTYEVPSESLIYVKLGSKCYAGFARAGMDFSILGDVFLKNYYVIYNTEVPEVQIAPSKA